MATASAPILELRGEYRDWSNFGRRPVRVFGREWATSEHAFQAAKFFGVDEEYVDLIAASADPGHAKRLGRTRDVPLRADWKEVCFGVMTLVVDRKFEQHPDLAAQLAESGDAVIVEGNNWNDELWGAVWRPEPSDGFYALPVWADRPGYVLAGRNWLGRVLMLLRRDLAA